MISGYLKLPPHDIRLRAIALGTVPGRYVKEEVAFPVSAGAVQHNYKTTMKNNHVAVK